MKHFNEDLGSYPDLLCAHNSSVSSIVDNLKLQDKTLKTLPFLLIRIVVKLSKFSHLFKYTLLHCADTFFAKYEKLVCTVYLILCRGS